MAALLSRVGLSVYFLLKCVYLGSYSLLLWTEFRTSFGDGGFGGIEITLCNHLSDPHVVFNMGNLQHDFVCAALLLSSIVLITVPVPAGTAESDMLLHMAAGRYWGRNKTYCTYSTTSSSPLFPNFLLLIFLLYSQLCFKGLLLLFWEECARQQFCLVE